MTFLALMWFFLQFPAKMLQVYFSKRAQFPNIIKNRKQTNKQNITKQKTKQTNRQNKAKTTKKIAAAVWLKSYEKLCTTEKLCIFFLRKSI